MTYPTIEEVHARIGYRGGTFDLTSADDIIKAACDLDRERRGGEGDLPDGWIAGPCNPR